MNKVSLKLFKNLVMHQLVVNQFDFIDIDIDYILVVCHFGLATGSGVKTQSNMRNESCTKPCTPR
jgi:hypothetical protein